MDLNLPSRRRAVLQVMRKRDPKRKNRGRIGDSKKRVIGSIIPTF